jgi:intracellular sulfur oxidation DsrE/DsrF family protein
MKKLVVFTLLLFSITFVHAQNRLNPVIQGFGSLYDVPFASVKADSTMEYKIVIEMRAPSDNAKEMHQYFEHIGRMYNLHIHDKVPQSKLHVAVVLFGPAAYTVLSNEAYREKYKTDNPNLKVFEEFKKAGIKTIVCGQSVMLHNIDPKTVSPNVDIATSRFVAVSTMQMKGYALFQMN